MSGKCPCGNPYSCKNEPEGFKFLAWTRIGDKGSLHMVWVNAARCEEWKRRTTDMTRQMSAVRYIFEDSYEP